MYQHLPAQCVPSLLGFIVNQSRSVLLLISGVRQGRAGQGGMQKRKMGKQLGRSRGAEVRMPARLPAYPSAPRLVAILSQPCMGESQPEVR